MSAIRLFPAADNEDIPVSVAEVIKRYLDEKEFQNESGAYTDKSLSRAKYYLDDFADKYGTRPLDQCHRNDLIKWLAGHKTWRATATRHDAVGSIVTAFHWAEDELGIRSPFRRPKFLGPPVQPRPAIRPEEYQAMRLLLRRAKTNRGRRARTREAFRVALAFLWKTGCRTSEMRNAEWREIDWIRGVLVLSQHKTVAKSGESRMIPVRRVLPLLRWLKKRRRDGQAKIFVNSIGKPWTCDRFAKEFRRFASIAGVREEVSAYCLRHSLCVRLLEKGASDRATADVLGHSSTKFISWYGRTTRTMADHLNNVLGKDKHHGKKP